MRRLETLALILVMVAEVPALVTGVSSGAVTAKRTVILSGDAVGSVHYGESQNTAARALVALIGKSDGDVQNANNGDCIISAALY